MSISEERDHHNIRNLFSSYHLGHICLLTELLGRSVISALKYGITMWASRTHICPLDKL